MVDVLTKAPEKWPLAATRCIFRGHLMDYETAAFIMAMEAQLGYTLTVEQGCYNAGGVAASAGTHDGGGVFDLAPFDFVRKVEVARSLGGFAWHRLPIPNVWGEHIHIGIRNHPTLSPAAKQQQFYFDQKPRKNGLAGEATDPNQFPPRPTPTFKYPPKVVAPVTFQCVGLNDDWQNLASDVPGLIADVRPLMMGVEEAYRNDYHKLVPERWGVRQVEENKATAGVAAIWDRRRLQAIGHSENPRKVGRGWEPIGQGADTRVRGVVWRDLKFRPKVDRGALPPRLRQAVVHRPPMRDSKDWPPFDAKLEAWLKMSPLDVLLFMDSNEHGGPVSLEKALAPKYVWHAVGESIDGVLSALPVMGVRQLPKRTSDHHPIVITLGAPA